MTQNNTTTTTSEQEEENNPLARSLVYLVSPRGGDNFYARVINGTDKEYFPEPKVPDWVPRVSSGMFSPEIEKRLAAAIVSGEISPSDYDLLCGSGAVQMQENGRISLKIWSRWMNVASAADRKLCLIHEAGHVALRHLERMLQVVNEATEPEARYAIAAVNNWAADFAVNDAVVRLEPEFEYVHKPRIVENGKARFSEKGEWHFLMPEEYGLPRNLSYEQYLHLMLDQAKEMAKRAQEMMDAMGEERGNSGGESGGDPQGKSGQRSSGHRNYGGYGYGDGDGEGGDEQTKEKLESAAKKAKKLMKENPEVFKTLTEAHEALTGEKHKQWSEKAQNMSGDEAVTAASNLKKQERELVGQAYKQSERTRGNLPGSIRNMVEKLLAPEQTPWNLIFRDLVASSVQSRLIEEMVIPNLMLINETHLEPWPGFALDQAFNITWLTDTSGSVSDAEYARACAELNGLLAVNKNIKLTYMECDAQMQKEEEVTNIEPMDPARKRELMYRRGYGGTIYTPAFKRILNQDTASDWVGDAKRPEKPHPEPDLIIVFTDGGVQINGEVFPRYRPKAPILWLVSPGNRPAPGMSNTAPDRVIEMFSLQDR